MYRIMRFDEWDVVWGLVARGGGDGEVVSDWMGGRCLGGCCRHNRAHQFVKKVEPSGS